MNVATALLFLAALTAAGSGLQMALLTTRAPTGNASAPARSGFDALDAVFVGVALALCAAGLLAMPLVEFGIFSLWALTGLLAITGLAAWWWAWRQARHHGRGWAVSVAPTSRREWAVLAGVLLLSALLFARPHESILGGADAGVYVSVGVNMAKTGGLLIHEPLLATLDPANAPALMRELPPWEQVRFLRFPGFYVDEARPDEVIPQFYTLHPLWLTVAYSLGGLHAALLMTPLWGVLGVWAVYMVGRRLLSTGAAWLPALLVLLTPLQLYFARYPTAEPIAQYFAWLGIWAFIGFANQDAPRRLFGLLAGLALGSLFLARIDMIFVLLLPAVWALYLLLGRRWSRIEWWFWLPFVLTTGYAALHGLRFSAPYTLSTYGVVVAFLRTQIWLLAGIGGVGLALLLLLSATQQQRLTRWAASVAQAMWPRYALAGLIVVAAVYGYFVRPRLGETIFAAYWYAGTDIPLTDHLNLVRLGWYLGPLGLLLAVTGGVLAALYAPWRVTWPVWLVGGAFTLFYVYNVLNNPFHIYAFRRYVPVVVPFLQLGAAYGLHWLWQRGGTGMRRRQWRTVVALLGIALVVTLLYNSRLIGRHVDDAGGVAQLDQLAAQFDEGAVLLFFDPAPVGLGAIFGTPLQYIHGLTAFDVQEEAVYPDRLAAQAAAWQAQGRPVYVVVRDDDATPLDLPMDAAALTRAGTFAWHTARLEQSYDHMPAAVIPVDYAMTIYRWTQPEP